MRVLCSRYGVCCCLALALLLVSASAGAKAGADWPGLGGRAGSGVSEETDLPIRWSPDDNIAWRTALPGRGHSSPIVVGDRVFVTTAVKGAQEPGHEAVAHTFNGQPFLHPDSVDAGYRHEYRVIALDADSGEIRWDRRVHEGVPFDNRHRAGSYASPTPVTDGERVFAYFGTPGLFALDMEGTLLWRAEVGPVGTLGMGVGSSPLLHGGLVILQVDEEHGERSSMVAFDAVSGELAWKTERRVQASWTTPTLVETAHGTRLLAAGNEWVVAYDPATGAEIWRMEGLRSNAIHRPLVHGDLAIFTAGYPQKVIQAIRLGGEGDLTGSDRLAWTYNKGTAYVSSNLAYDGHVYLLSDAGVVTCLEAGTGEVVYEGGRMPVAQRFFASPIAYEGKVLLTGADGEMFLVKAGSEFEVLATNSVGEPIYATPAIANGRIFVRTVEALWAIGGTS